MKVLLHHKTKFPTSSLYSESTPATMHPVVDESLEDIYRWCEQVPYWKSSVYRVNRDGSLRCPSVVHHHL